MFLGFVEGDVLRNFSLKPPLSRHLWNMGLIVFETCVSIKSEVCNCV